MKKFKIISLFSGAGGTEILLNKDKFEVIGHAEILQSAIAVLKYHYPSIQNYGDIVNLNTQISKKTIKIPEYDILLGGTPCQDFSYQGSRNGLDGQKSSLFFHYLNFLKETKPNYFLWENVKGSLTSKEGKDFQLILDKFREIGYEVEYRVFEANKFGTIQARERVFVIGTRKDIKKTDSKKLDSVIYGGKKYKQIKGKKIIAYSKSTRHSHVDYRIREDGLLNTLTTGYGCVGQSTANYVHENGVLRFLTPNECESLMLWPKDWTKFGINHNNEKYELSETDRYKLIGNGIVSTIPSEILDQIIN